MSSNVFGWDLPPGCTARDCDGESGTAMECHVCGNEASRTDDDGRPVCTEHKDWVYDPLGFGYHWDTWVYVCECGRHIDESMSYTDDAGGPDFYECDICGRKQTVPGQK